MQHEIMNTIDRRSFIAASLSAVAVGYAPSAILAAPPRESELANSFYAMDTSFQRPGLNRD